MVQQIDSGDESFLPFIADAAAMVEAVREESKGSPPFQMVLTSPPYWHQRKYNALGEIGWEDTPVAYIAVLVNLFGGVSSILRDDGTLWVNIGDKRDSEGSKLNIPSRFAEAMRMDGWIVQQEIVWHKPDAIPRGAECNIRPSENHEMVYMFTKSKKFFYDAYAVRSPTAALRTVWTIPSSGKGKHSAPFPRDLASMCILASTSEKQCANCGKPYERKLHTQRVPTRPGKGNFKDESGMSNRDPQRHVTEYRSLGYEKSCACKTKETSPQIVFDPFLGSGTTATVASILGRIGVGCDSNSETVMQSIRNHRLIVEDSKLIGSIKLPKPLRPFENQLSLKFSTPKEKKRKKSKAT